MPADPSDLTASLDAIASELERLFPNLPEPSPDDVANGGPFGMATMAFAQWLRFVFVPIARRRIAENDLPTGSSLAAHAVREFDGFDDASELIGRLADFDVLVSAG